MNLTDIKPTQTAKEFSNSVKDTFGVEVDISKLNLDKSAKLLLSVNEQIQKQRLSEDRHRLHTTKSYLAKIFIKENLEKHIAELDEEQSPAQKAAFQKMLDAKNGNKEETTDDDDDHYDFKKSADREKGSKGSNKQHGFGEGVNEEKLNEKHDDDKDFEFDPKGLVALRRLVGTENMMRAKKAIEMAKRGKAVPAVFMKAFIPLIDIVDDIMLSGMANVQMLNNLTRRARKSLGVEESKEVVSDQLRNMYESQEDQAELLLATKDVVDRVQKAVDDLSKLRNEDLPPLLDAMRDEVGSEISSAYSNIAIPTLDQLVDGVSMSRETLAQASRILTGEEQMPQAMGAEAPVEEMPPAEEEMPPAQDFEAADVAAGEEELGRAERE